MARTLTILMYHYVRDLARSRYPAIKGLDIADFAGQLDYLRKHYHPISGHDLLAAIADDAPLPPRAVLLTFDDGFADHFTHVFPLLDAAGISGAFFPPAACIYGDLVLDVNKIHFLLAGGPPVARLIEDLFTHIRAADPALGLRTPETYRSTVDTASRWDEPDVAFFKKMLQRELPASFRADVLALLFKRYVCADEKAFARELYMTPEQLRCMVRHGQFVGNHGYAHLWLNHLDAAAQAAEVQTGLEFLKDMGMDTTRWMMNYPYGGCDEKLRAYLRGIGCTAALSTRVDLADLDRDDPLLLPRLNTNDLPFSGDAVPAAWTLQLT